MAAGLPDGAPATGLPVVLRVRPTRGAVRRPRVTCLSGLSQAGVPHAKRGSRLMPPPPRPPPPAHRPQNQGRAEQQRKRRWPCPAFLSASRACRVSSPWLGAPSGLTIVPASPAANSTGFYLVAKVRGDVRLCRRVAAAAAACGGRRASGR